MDLIQMPTNLVENKEHFIVSRQFSQIFLRIKPFFF